LTVMLAGRKGILAGGAEPHEEKSAPVERGAANRTTETSGKKSHFSRRIGDGVTAENQGKARG